MVGSVVFELQNTTGPTVVVIATGSNKIKDFDKSYDVLTEMIIHIGFIIVANIVPVAGREVQAIRIKVIGWGCHNCVISPVNAH